MWVVIFALFSGVILGLSVNLQISDELIRFLALSLLAAFDTIVGGIRSYLQGLFDELIFITGFIFNILISILLAYFGMQLGLDLYLAAVVVFGIRLFQNFAVIRRTVVTKWMNRWTK